MQLAKVIKGHLIQIGLLVCLIWSSCETQQGHIGLSEDIDFSKFHKLFVCEYVFERDTLIIQDSIILIYKSIWLEKSWKHGTANTIIPGSTYQLIIDLEEESSFPDFRNFNVGISSDSYCRPTNNHCLVCDFESIPSSDTLSWQIQRSSNFMVGMSHDIYGELRVLRKK